MARGADDKYQGLGRRGFQYSRQYQAHQQSGAPPRLYSKASTDATAGGKGNGRNSPATTTRLPWEWWPDAINTHRYLQKHKNGMGLLFYRLAETPVELRKTALDETDIWVHVGTVEPHVWGGKPSETTKGCRPEEDEDGQLDV